MKLGPQRNYHKGRAAIRHYANQPARQFQALVTPHHDHTGHNNPLFVRHLSARGCGYHYISGPYNGQSRAAEKQSIVISPFVGI